MRAYFFVNGLYMSQIQLGIQSLHCTSEMFVKYAPPLFDDTRAQWGMLEDWGKNHRTVILLNALNVAGIREIRDFIATHTSKENGDGGFLYPWADFYEDEDSLNGALTCAGLVLPPKIYEGAQVLRQVKRLRRDDPARMDFEFNHVLSVDLQGDGEVTDVAYTGGEVELMERLGTYRLA